MKNLKLIIILAGIINLILSQIGWAEEKNKGVTRIEDIVVTATKYETSAKDIPASITVITSEEIENQNLPNGDIGDVLRSVPGITLRRAYGPFPAYPNIRGAGSDATVILVNGIPTNWEITQAIPSENIERIEIVRGPASALYGANAAGGVINIIMKQGKDEFKSSLSAGYGTFETYRSKAWSSGRVDKLGYSIAASYEDSEGDNVVHNNVIPSVHMIDTCDYEKHAFSINTDYSFSDSAKLLFMYNFFHDEYIRGRPNHGGDWDRHFAGIIYDQRLGERFKLNASLGYRYDDLLHLYDKGGTNYDKNRKRYTDYYETPVELKITGALGWGHTLTGGYFYNKQETDQDYSDWLTGDPWRENKYKVETQAGYLQDVWKPVEELIITAGLRYDHWENYDNHFSNFVTSDPKDRTDDNWSPKIGARYNFTNETSIWGNYSVGFKPPSSVQLYDDRTSGGNPRQPNPDLKPEKTESYELGLEQWFCEILQTRITGFHSITEDKIISWFDTNNVWVNKNIGRTKSYGVEFDAGLHLLENWLINANYTWNSAKIDKNPSDPEQEDNWLPFSPEHKANLGITYEQKKNFTASIFGRYLSEQHTNNDNTKYTSAGEKRYMDESFVVDIKAVKHFPISKGYVKNIDLSLSIDNIFDEDYRTFYMYEDPGTVFFGEVKIIF